jgi:hypothetical protein
MKNAYFPKFSKIFAVTLILGGISPTSAAQTYINKEWLRTTGVPDGTDWTGTTFDSEKHLIIVGNTVTSSGNADILITKYDPDGNIVWQRTMAGSSRGNDYGVAVITDNQNNIFVAAALTSSNGMFDFGVIKYSSTGDFQWFSHWDNGLQDIPTAMALDDSGNIIVVGATTSFSQQMNYAIVKWNSNGTRIWATEYDFAGLYDFATAVVKATANNIVVTGASASATNNWDYATILINGQGQIQNVNRITVPEIGLDQPLAITRNLQGNTFITGYTEVNGNKNIQTIKLNNNFGLEWVKTFDGGLDDVAKTIGVDDFGNVYIGGYTKNTDQKEKSIVIKYDANGNELWQKKMLNEAKSEVAEVQVLPSGEVYVVGQLQQANNQEIVTIKYAQNGVIEWEKHAKTATANDPKHISVDEIGNVYVTTIAQTTNAKWYETIKYKELKRNNAVLFQNAKPSHRDRELIVKFNPNMLQLPFVNDKEIKYGSAEVALKAEMIDALENALPFPVRNNEQVQFLKINYEFTASDTISISRLGDKVPVPKFWSELLMLLPDDINLEDINLRLSTLVPYIHYSEFNYVGQLATLPNDTFIQPNSNYQSSLISSNYPDAHINILPAWQIETGKKYVKIGVFDDLIYWKHPEFGGMDAAHSVIKGGRDYINNLTDMTTFSTPLSSHGTAVGGIIGSMSNNSIGIAGIAGGNIANRDTGVSLFTLGISDHSSFVSNDAIGSAIRYGAYSNYLGLHIQNHSWTTGGGGNYLRESVRFAFKNQCVLVAARGNSGTDQGFYPAGYADPWVISVGASGWDGKQKTFVNGQAPFQASYGDSLDLIAPGTSEIMLTTTSPIAPQDANCNLINPDYTCFWGSSAAAPHVTGVAGLLLSRHNTNQNYPNNLAPEDIEYILEKSATDVVGQGVLRINGADRFVNYAPSYDRYNGHGLLNAGKALQMIHAPRYKILHPTDVPVYSDSVLVQRDVSIMTEEDINGLARGNWWYGDVYRMTERYTHIFPDSIRILDAWGRLSSTVGLDSVTFNVRDNPMAKFLFTFVNRNQVNVTATSTYFKVKTGTNTYIWIPNAPNSTRRKMPYSLYLENALHSKTADLIENGLFEVYPNPVSSNIIINYSADFLTTHTTVQIIDIAGRVLKEVRLSKTAETTIEIDCTDLSTGTYIVKLANDKGVWHKKIVKL